LIRFTRGVNHLALTLSVAAGLASRLSVAHERIPPMVRMFIEGWSPEYGAPIDPDDRFDPTEGSVDAEVERSSWEPLDGVDDGVTRIAFVDGVRRVDARLVLEDPNLGPIPGICGSFAVGAAVWSRPERRTEIAEARVERWAVLAGGRSEQFPSVDLDPPLLTTTTPADDPANLVWRLHTLMRKAEGTCATRLAESGCFVVADGPLNELAPQPTVGYVKSHRVTYLSSERNAVVRQLTPGQRTPLFAIADYKRYAWYLRLAHVLGGHSWSGIVRCEASGALPKDDVRALADRTAAILPGVASEPHLDPRAPQNLVPIGALERALRHRMGDPGLVLRALRGAVAEREAS
jgi:hypothetical protein